jgi:hypothetical protein
LLFVTKPRYQLQNIKEAERVRFVPESEVGEVCLRCRFAGGEEDSIVKTVVRNEREYKV